METRPDPLAPAQQFESAYFARKLFAIVERLAAEGKDGWTLEVKDCGLFFKQLTLFIEKNLGRNATERRFPKLPAHLLRDTSLNGSVQFILKTYRSYLKDNGVPAIDFSDNDSLGQKMAFVTHLRDAVMKAGLLKNPVVHVDVSVSNRREEMEAIVRSLGGSVTSSAEDPSTTHIVYPFGPEGDPDDGVQYLRSLEKGQDEFFVHYWYFPDGYDNWMPAEVAPESLEPDRKPIGPWKVYLRWLIDSQRFNEWMNPIDYETEEFQDEQEALQDQAEDTKTLEEEEEEEESNEMNSDEDADSVVTDEKAIQKRKRDALMDFLSRPPSNIDVTSSASDGRRLRSDSHRPEVVEGAEKKIAPKVTQHFPTEDLSMGRFDGTVEDLTQCIEEMCDDELEYDKEEDETEFYRQLYTVPVHASWFNADEINIVEREGVPVRSAEQSTGVDPGQYKRWRNAMIDRFRERPQRHLTFSEVRKKLTGDGSELRSVYDFLTKWGLINFVPASTPRSMKRVKGDVDDGTSVTVPCSAPPIIYFSNSVTLPEMNAAVTHGNELAFGLLNKPNKYGKTVTDASSQPGGIRCSAMPWIDCTDTYYHCITIPDIDLCPQAYAEGRFPAGTTSKDYIKMKLAQKDEEECHGWTDQETLLLLEAIEMYRDDWAEISEHVATKSQLQCAMHWLTMSIEDDFVDDTLTKDPDVAFHGTEEEFAKSLPFADARNPVMAQIAFLSAVVSPEVAGAAAKEALRFLSEEDGKKESEIMEKSPAGQRVDIKGGKEAVLDTSNQERVSKGPVDIESMRKAAIAGLKSATVKAKLLAEQQEREIQKLMNTVINAQIKKIDIKLNYCLEQDKALDEERGRLETARLQMISERLPPVPRQTTADAIVRPGHPTESMDNGVSHNVNANGQTER